MRALASEMNASFTSRRSLQFALDTYRTYKTFGVLPEDGGTDDQDWEVIEAIRTLKYAEREVEMKRRDERRRRLERMRKEKERGLNDHSR